MPGRRDAGLHRCGPGPGPLFRFADGAGLTRSRFVAQIREALRTAGVDESRYNGHSFRIGAATTAAARGIEDCVIKTVGRWDARPTCNMYGSLAVSSRATPGCWRPRRKTVSRDCPLCCWCLFCFLVMLLQLSWGEAGLRPVPGQGWRACCPSSAPPPCGSLRVAYTRGLYTEREKGACPARHDRHTHTRRGSKEWSLWVCS